MLGRKQCTVSKEFSSFTTLTVQSTLCNLFQKNRKIITPNYLMWRVFKLWLEISSHGPPRGTWKLQTVPVPSSSQPIHHIPSQAHQGNLGSWLRKGKRSWMLRINESVFPPTDYVTVSENPDRGQLTLQSILRAWMPIYLSNTGPISWNQMEILWKLSTGWSHSKASAQWDRSSQKREPIALHFSKFGMPHKTNSIFHLITIYIFFIFSNFY